MGQGAQWIDIRFPSRGIDKGVSLDQMPEDVAPQVINMVSMHGGYRKGGGKRPGLTTAVSGSFVGTPRVGIITPSSDGVTRAALVGTSGGNMSINRATVGVGMTWVNETATPITFGSGRMSLAQLGDTVYGVSAVSASTNGDFKFNTITGVPQLWSHNADGVTGTRMVSDLMVSYRARLLVAKRDGTNWMCSAVGLPNNWNVGDTAIAAVTRAVQGAGSTAGVPGSPIRSLISFGDDYCIFGGPREIWWLEGDPGYGGRMQMMCDSTGMPYTDGWCKDANNNLWFISNTGLYVLERGSTIPRLMVADRMTALLERRTTTNELRLTYDRLRKWIIISPVDTWSGRRTHIVYMPDTDELETFETENGVWPKAVLNAGMEYDITNAVMWVNDSKAVYFYDGILTDMNPATGSAANFNCLWRSRPIELDPNRETTALEIQAFGADGTGACTWYWLTAPSADELMGISDGAIAANAVATGTFFSSGSSDGRIVAQGLRATGGAHQLVISQESNAQLRLARFNVLMEPAGLRRITTA